MLFRRIGIFGYLLVALFSCTSKEGALERALRCAQTNRNALECVLDGYREDSFKYACAEFLIVNSMNQYAVATGAIDSIEAILSDIANTPDKWGASREQIDRWGRYPFANAPRIPDIEAISPRMLVANIDSAVSAYRSKPWNKNLSVSGFMQLILPYRIGDERLCDWRGLYADKYGRVLDSMYCGDDAVKACGIVLEAMAKEPNKFNDQFSCPHHSASWLFTNWIGNCRDACDRMLYALRACGIPVTTDHILISPENGASHQWMAVRDNKTGRFVPFDSDLAPDRYASDVFDATRLKGKVYRRLIENVNVSDNEALPSERYVDVTSEYFGENEARVPVEREADDVCLGVFCNGFWHAIGNGRREGDEYVFRNVEPGVYYAALSRDKDGNGAYAECSNAFVLLDDGSTRVFDGASHHMTKTRLTRKRMLNTRMLRNWMHNDMVGCRLALSDSKDFGNAIFSYDIDRGLANNRLVVKPRGSAKSRYMLYTSPLDHIGIAELIVMSGGKRVDYTASVPGSADVDLSPICDGHPATHARIPASQCILDFGTQTKVDSIIVVPRNDDNYVWPGDKYELMAHRGADGWESLGQKVAADTVLTWDVPENTLLWLRDLTRGHEEQPFIIKDGQQWFTLKFRIKPFSWAL